MLNREIVAKLQRNVEELTFEALVNVEFTKAYNSPAMQEKAKEDFKRAMAARKVIEALLA